MNTDDHQDFYHSLSDIEQRYWHELQRVFKMVQPQKPDKGCKALILRARHLALTQQLPLEETLQRELEGATQRTLRRLELLKSCPLAPAPTPDI